MSTDGGATADGFRNRYTPAPAYPLAMALSEQARRRLADVVELQPTKNAELQERWDVDSGSDVHAYLEGELSEYYYRDDNSLIRATAEAADLVDVAPGIEEGEGDGPGTIRVPPLQARVAEVVAGPDERSMSVVAVVQALRDEGVEATAEAVRSALRDLANKGVLEVVQRTVPTYRLAAPREALTVEERGDADEPVREDDREAVIGRLESEFEVV